VVASADLPGLVADGRKGLGNSIPHDLSADAFCFVHCRLKWRVNSRGALRNALGAMLVFTKTI
jgi:hypothetical protein